MSISMGHPVTIYLSQQSLSILKELSSATGQLQSDIIGEGLFMLKHGYSPIAKVETVSGLLYDFVETEFKDQDNDLANKLLDIAVNLQLREQEREEIKLKEDEIRNNNVSTLGHLGGQSKSPIKVQASKENGKKGGRVSVGSKLKLT